MMGEDIHTPKHILKMLNNVRETRQDYVYYMFGTNIDRLKSDINILGAWATSYYADFALVEVHNLEYFCYGVFKITDPVCSFLERNEIVEERV